jgi:hypothetical protein
MVISGNTGNSGIPESPKLINGVQEPISKPALHPANKPARSIKKNIGKKVELAITPPK